MVKPAWKAVGSGRSRKIKPAFASSSRNSRVSFSKTANIGGYPSTTAPTDVLQGRGMFYSPTLSTDFYELPRSLREERMWYRWFFEHHPIIGRGIDMHTNLPLSKVTFTRPASRDHEKARKIQDFFEKMWKRIKGSRMLIMLSHHWWLYGEAFPFLEYDEETKQWSSVTILDGGNIEVKKVPFESENQLFLVPDPEEVRMARDTHPSDSDSGLQEVFRMLTSDGRLPLDTDPMSGSHVVHLMRQKNGEGTRGVSILKRCLTTLLYQDKLRQAQTQISSRNMTPKHLIWADGLNTAQLDELRLQIDSAFSEPDFAVLANKEVHWQVIGANDRLLDLIQELELTDTHLHIGMGLTKEITSGEGNWGSTRINLEVMNTEYLFFREILQDFVEEHIFRPIAIANGFVEENEFGGLDVLYPRVRFTRLSIRDNESVFGDMFTLYQKGSLPTSVLYDLYNLDAQDIEEQLREEVFTLSDTNFNEASRQAMQAIGDALASEPDIRMKVAESLGIKPSPLFLLGGENGGGSSFGGAGAFSADFGGDFGGGEDLGGDFGEDLGGDFGEDLGGDFGGDIGEDLGGDLGGDFGGGGEAPEAPV